MHIFQNFATFIIDEWLYSISLGAYHMPIALFIMLFLFKVILGMRIIPAVFLTLIANVGSVALFSACAMVIGHMHTSGYAHMPQELSHPLLIAVCLGALYALLQTVLFLILSRYYTLKLPALIAVSFISNILAALCVYILPTN